MISNRCARKSLVTNCNSIISKNYMRFLVDSNENNTILKLQHKALYSTFSRRIQCLLNCFPFELCFLYDELTVFQNKCLYLDNWYLIID